MPLTSHSTPCAVLAGLLAWSHLAPTVSYAQGTDITTEVTPPSSVATSPAPSDEVILLDAVEVTESGPTRKMEAVSVRLDADKLVNVFSAEDFSKFAAGDVASALNRVSGVNVIEGQFAIIRGMEDRYSSTLYNGAPIPSPDPDSQSVQLDLFPSDIVNNLVVAKTFSGDLPGNSAGGSLNIITHGYPATPEIKVGGSTGFNQNAADRFLKFQSGSPMGTESSTNDIIESDFGFSLGGKGKLQRFGERELRYKASFSREVDYDTKTGWQEGREPRASRTTGIQSQRRSGDLAFGQLSLSDGRFDYTDSTRTQQTNAYVGFGLDLDEAGNHKIDASFFYTVKEEQQVQLKENGYIPGFDYTTAAERVRDGNSVNRASFGQFATRSSWIAGVRDVTSFSPSAGHAVFTNVNESTSFDKERDLLVAQINGSHKVPAVDGLTVGWALNRAKTTQEETAFGVDYFYEPLDLYQVPTTSPALASDLGDGAWAANNRITYSSNTVEENQDFGRLDLNYDRELSTNAKVTLSGGGFWEKSERSVASAYLPAPTASTGGTNVEIFGDTPSELGEKILGGISDTSSGKIIGLHLSDSDAQRDIKAFNLGSKFTLFRKLDLLGSFRFEDIFIASNNDPFIRDANGNIQPDAFGGPRSFPTRYVFFDRLDNAARGERAGIAPPGTVYNDQLLGINVPVDGNGLVDLTTEDEVRSLMNGKIDEEKWLPALGLAYRVNSRLTLRAAYSQTVARPSFRELGYYLSVDPGSSDLTLGNPQLSLSEVENWDARVEYTWGEKGDLVAFSVFQKDVQNAIESFVVRDPIDLEGGSLYRTFFNNPNDAQVRGLEFEARKDLGFLGADFAEFFSLGGNITYIDAEVDRTPFEIARAQAFFNTIPADSDRATFTSLNPSRRLYNQPEWIANVDLTFDQPEWGTTATLAVFAISDVLDAAGSASLDNNNTGIAYTLDRYTDQFYQVDFVISQKWRDWTFRLSVKNLTDSTRKVVYDPEQLIGEVAERAYKVGRDYTLSASYQF